jgi:hypothetical protein
MRLLRLPARIWTILLGCTAALLALGFVARLLLPLAPLTPAPALISTEPARSAVDVLPRSTITLSFAGPMNRASVVRALQIDPPTPGRLHWSPDGQTLTFTPAVALSPATTYTITLSTAAQDRWWRPLPEPVSISFRTAPQPAVLSALPATNDAPRESSLVVIFSQPMVTPVALNRDVDIPQLRFTPPLPYRARWIAVDTLLVRPINPLPAAQTYRATITADLTDARGIELGAPYSWRFSTAWPTILERTPPSGARSVSPQSPLSLTFDAPIDLGLLRNTLTISPPMPGTLSAETVGTTQVVTFTPERAWEPEQTYTVSLTPPAGSALADPPDLRWRFTIEARPGLAAFFPGQGQTLRAEQAIRLVFTTPMDAETLAAGISFDPPVAEVPIRVSNTEARLTPELAPSTAYTITVAAGTPDRNGAPLPNDIVLQLRSDTAPPALRAVDAAAGLITLPISRTARIDFERINIDALDLSLYALDVPTLRLALAIGPTGLATFSPERYGQPQLRTWRVNLNDPPDTLSRSSIPVDLGDEAPLAPGAYLLRAVTGAGPRVDLLLIVSNITLTMRHNDTQVLVWATDAVSGAPRSGVPITLYANDALVASGATDTAGIFALPLRRNPADALYLALSDGPELAVVRADWILDNPGATPPGQARYQALIRPDKLAYLPGEALQINGRVRRIAANGALTLPTALACRLQLLAPGPPAPPSLQAAICRVTANGRLSATAQLPLTVLPGDYRLRVTIADSAFDLPLNVRVVDRYGTTLTVTEQTAASLTLTATTGGLPLPDAPVTWSLSFSALPPPADDIAAGYRFAEAATVTPLTGSARTDAAGRVTIPLPAEVDQPLQFHLNAGVSAPGATGAHLGANGILTAADRVHLGMRLPAQFVTSNDRAAITFVVRDALGAPVAGNAIDVSVVRAGAADGPPLLSRRITSAADGQATTQLVPLGPGRYTISAATGATTTQATLWVTAPNYSAWTNPRGQVRLIPDRPAYAVGDTARLLITSPWPTATLLLTSERGDLRAAEVQTLQAGAVLEFPITADLTPGFGLGAVLTTGAERRVGSTTIAVLPTEAPLSVGVTADSPSYPPGATATLSITLPDDVRAADLLVALAPADLPDLEPADAGIAPQAPPPLTVAGHPPLETGARITTISTMAGRPGYFVSGDAGAGGPGLTTLQIPLPREAGDWRITVYALDGVSRAGRAATVVSVQPPLGSELRAPATLRHGDAADVTVELVNTAPMTRSLQIGLDLQGATLATPGAADQQLRLAPESAQTVTWRIAAAATAERVLARVQIAEGSALTTLERTLTVAPPTALPPFNAGTTSATGPVQLTIPLDPAATQLEIALAPSLPAALADTAERLAAAEDPSTVDRAALALIAARLAPLGDTSDDERWRNLAVATVDDLQAMQNNDGGWGWWPNTPSEPFVSAFVVEALGANRALLGAQARPDPRAPAYLARVTPSVDPDLRAYLAFAAARAGQLPAGSADLLDEELSAAGLAYLALALPAGQAGPAIDRLLALPGPPWEGAEQTRLPSGGVAVNAAVAEALRSRQPNAPQLAAVESFLREAWGVDGWGGAFSAARIAGALPLNQSSAGGPRRITLNDQQLIGAATPLSSTVRISIPAEELGATATLGIETSGAAPYLVAYRSAAEAPPVRAPAAVIGLTYHDAATGALIAPTQLRAGQLVEVRIQTIATAPITGAAITVDLPTALLPLEAPIRTPFVHVQIAAEIAQVRLFAPRLEAGVAQQTVLVRVAARGAFVQPPPRLSTPDGAEPGPIITLAPAFIMVR